MALPANLPRSPRVIPGDQHPTSPKGNAMSRTTHKGRLVTLAVVAGLLAAAGPVSASAHKESFSIDIGTSEKIAVAAYTVVTDNKDPDKLQNRSQPDGIIAVLIGLNHA
jgi:hypothetical protein